MIKNGQVYRDTDRNSDYEDLAVYSDGSFKTFKESDTTVQKLVDSGVVNTFAFGPTLVENGKVALLTGLGMSWVKNRASKLLFNSAIAVVASACLVKGIVEVSGRTTSVDMPYWYVAAGLLCLSLLTGFIRPKRLA